jgi:hypothetical protein
VIIFYFKRPVKHAQIKQVIFQADSQTVDLSDISSRNQISNGSIRFDTDYFEIDYEKVKDIKVHVGVTLTMSGGSLVEKVFEFKGEKQTETESIWWLFFHMVQ